MSTLIDARRAAERLRQLLASEGYVNALGATTADQAVQQVKAGLKAVYLSGEAAPALLRRVNHAFHRDSDDWAPIVADGEAGVGGAFDQMKALLEAGAAGVHFGDRLANAAVKVLVPTREAIEQLAAARRAADMLDVPAILIARTDAEGTDLLTSDCDPIDQAFCTGERSPEGFYRTRPGMAQAVARALAYAPCADLLWCETRKPDLVFAKAFADAVHAQFPGKMLAYHCSSDFNWKEHLDDASIARFQKELGAMGYKFQFTTLAGLPVPGDGMFKLAHGYARRQMTALVEMR